MDLQKTIFMLECTLKHHTSFGMACGKTMSCTSVSYYDFSGLKLQHHNKIETCPNNLTFLIQFLSSCVVDTKDLLSASGLTFCIYFLNIFLFWTLSLIPASILKINHVEWA